MSSPCSTPICAGYLAQILRVCPELAKTGVAWLTTGNSAQTPNCRAKHKLHNTACYR